VKAYPPFTFTESTLAERWSGGQWAIQPTPSPGTGGIGQLTGISCLSATDCTAVGIISTQTASNSTLAEHWDGTSWTVVPSPDPAGTTVTDFTGVSCASATSCTAVGVYDTSGNRPHELPLAEQWDGTSWTVTRLPLPAGITAGDLDGGVSCPSATYCIAVGIIATPNQPSNTQPLAERWNGTKWTVQATPTPASAYNPFLSGVSCSAPAHCTAVGGYLANGSTDSSLVERRDSTAWTIQADAASGGRVHNQPDPNPDLTPPAAIAPATIATGGIFGAATRPRGEQGALSVGNWQLDPYHTQVEFSAKHLGMMTVRGYFDEVSTVADIDPDHPETSSVEATISTASLRTNNGVRDNDIKSSNFLEAGKYPFIKFMSTSVEPSGQDHYKLTGDLTIKETTRPVVLDVVKYGEFNDPGMMGHRISYGATTKINRKDFGLSFNAILDGRMVVSEEIQIAIEGELVEQPQAAEAADS
jgi:polyisoprenoid-binding protein YceI